MACAPCRRLEFYDVARRVGLAFVLPMMLPAVAAAQAGAGKALFEARCHDDGPAGLRTEPERLAALLRNGTVRQHRFALSAMQLSELVDYVRRARPAAKEGGRP